MVVTRRQLLKGSAAAGIGLLVTGKVPAMAAPGKGSGQGFGPLQSDPGGLLDLPIGFKYSVVSRAGQPVAGQPAVMPGARTAPPPSPVPAAAWCW